MKLFGDRVLRMFSTVLNRRKSIVFVNSCFPITIKGRLETGESLFYK